MCTMAVKDNVTQISQYYVRLCAHVLKSALELEFGTFVYISDGKISHKVWTNATREVIFIRD